MSQSNLGCNEGGTPEQDKQERHRKCSPSYLKSHHSCFSMPTPVRFGCVAPCYRKHETLLPAKVNSMATGKGEPPLHLAKRCLAAVLVRPRQWTTD
jgi:hypothetical protein